LTRIFIHLAYPLYLGKSKMSFFKSIIYIIQIIYIISGGNKRQPLHSSLAAYLLLFSASHYLCSQSSASGTRYRRSAARVLIRTGWGLRQRLELGWISAQRSVLSDRLVAKKTGSMYPCRMCSLWTLAVTVLAWHSSCYTSQPVLFRATDVIPQPALLRATNIRMNATNLHSGGRKSSAFHKLVWWHCFRVR